MRDDSALGIIKRLRERGVTVVAYEPLMQAAEFMQATLLTDLADFKRRADVILANRRAPELADVAHKVYTRDLYGRD